jgi:hypothetical protein
VSVVPAPSWSKAKEYRTAVEEWSTVHSLAMQVSRVTVPWTGWRAGGCAGSRWIPRPRPGRPRVGERHSVRHLGCTPPVVRILDEVKGLHHGCVDVDAAGVRRSRDGGHPPARGEHPRPAPGDRARSCGHRGGARRPTRLPGRVGPRRGGGRAAGRGPRPAVEVPGRPVARASARAVGLPRAPGAALAHLGPSGPPVAPGRSPTQAAPPACGRLATAA